jgi:hypothetical protein
MHHCWTSRGKNEVGESAADPTKGNLLRSSNGGGTKQRRELCGSSGDQDYFQASLYRITGPHFRSRTIFIPRTLAHHGPVATLFSCRITQIQDTAHQNGFLLSSLLSLLVRHSSRQTLFLTYKGRIENQAVYRPYLDISGKNSLRIFLE